ncbi:MAG: hypothetical protein C0424_06495 [Sphingobacteriaceae bacterium]|nr:hypothetical protein [Sphingobacteriaceae bacterium]
MQKVPLNQEGLNQKISYIKNLPLEEYFSELHNLQHHTKQWCIENFDLTNEQISAIMGAPEALFSLIGLNSRIAIEFNHDLELENVEDNPNYLLPDCKLKVKGGGTYTPSTGDWSGKFTISIGLP